GAAAYDFLETVVTKLLLYIEVLVFQPVLEIGDLAISKEVLNHAGYLRGQQEQKADLFFAVGILGPAADEDGSHFVLGAAEGNRTQGLNFLRQALQDVAL